MKTRISIFAITLLISIATIGQSPQAFKYQTVVRDADGNLIQDQNVSFKMGILDLNMNNFQETLEYEETHSVSTNELGLVNLFIGGGTVISGSMSTIDWGQEDHTKYLVIDLDVNGGTTYESMGYSPLASVPYALYAESTGDIDEIVNFDGDTKINMPFNDKSIRFISQDIEFMRMTNQGYLGIGTTTPNEMLEINGGSIRMQDGNQGAGKIMVSDGMGTASWTDPSLLGGGGWTVSGADMYSSVGGNVGIGTSNPGAKLDVAGHIWQTGLGGSVFIGKNAGENDDLSDNRNIFIGENAGQATSTGPYNIGIGYYTLNNNTSGFGNIALGLFALGQNSTGSYNFAFGENTLHDNTIGDYNIAIGTWAMVHNIEGDNNIGFGSHCLMENTLGNDNIAFGKFTLSNNTTGHSNVAIGAKALNNNTTHSNLVAIGDSALYHNGVGASSNNHSTRNTAIGTKALYANTTGYANTTVGFEAMQNNTTGYVNCAFGNHSLYTNSTGSGNSAFGDYALLNNISGGYNTAIGIETLYNNTYGQFNTGIGIQALYSNSNGSYNTAGGYWALGQNQTGEYNTAFGMRAGNSNINGNGSVFLGYKAGYNETGSNKLYIENSDVTSNNALIYGEFDNDILKFHADVQLTKSAGNEMIIKNDNQWEHYNGDQNFGNGGDYFIMASKEGSAESAGIFGDGNHTTIWSPGDAATGQNAGYLYILDEDGFTDADGDPYNNGALKAYLNTSGNWISVSDKNKKENIKKLSSSLDKLMSINGYSYTLKQNAEEKMKATKQETTYGVLAQEVENVLPEVIEKNEDGEYFVSYTEFIPVLIEAVKEQQQTIEELQQSIELLQNEVNQLKKN